MRKFRFSLDAALRLRRVELRSAETKLQELIAQEQRVRRSLDGITFERREASTYIQQNPTDVPALRALPSYFIGLEWRRTNLARSLDAIVASIRQQRARVAELEQSVKLVDELRNRRLAEWQKEADREIEAVAQECWLATHSRIRKI